MNPELAEINMDDIQTPELMIELDKLELDI